ncbi:MAG: hypothetical protein V4692_07750 [Bdellovibrionota bacterium]
MKTLFFVLSSLLISQAVQAEDYFTYRGLAIKLDGTIEAQSPSWKVQPQTAGANVRTYVKPSGSGSESISVRSGSNGVEFIAHSFFIDEDIVGKISMYSAKAYTVCAGFKKTHAACTVVPKSLCAVLRTEMDNLAKSLGGKAAAAKCLDKVSTMVKALPQALDTTHEEAARRAFKLGDKASFQLNTLMNIADSGAALAELTQKCALIETFAANEGNTVTPAPAARKTAQ